MTPEGRKKEYEGSALQALMKASGHEICERCYCCDLVSESATCWQCNGMWEPDDGWCDVCQGEGEIYFKACIGRCDEQGNHAHKIGERDGEQP